MFGDPAKLLKLALQKKKKKSFTIKGMLENASD